MQLVTKYLYLVYFGASAAGASAAGAPLRRQVPGCACRCRANAHRFDVSDEAVDVVIRQLALERRHHRIVARNDFSLCSRIDSRM